MSETALSVYSSKQLSRICRITLRQVQWWSENRLLLPKMVGHSRVFSEEDVRRARILRQLNLRNGLSCAAVQPLVTKFAKACAGYAILSADGRKARFCLTKQEVLQVGSSLKRPFRLIELGGTD